MAKDRTTKNSGPGVNEGVIDQHKRMAMGKKVTGQTLKKGGKVVEKRSGGRGC
jgi:hypothetical protein